jgi:alpha-ketoglutarate-dependent 2,4-dichlorophenoxyacetate dioxygenase
MGSRKRAIIHLSLARSIVGRYGVQSRELTDDLLERATESDDVYIHRWRTEDTVVWDIRCTLHRGAGYDADRWRRRMRLESVYWPQGLSPCAVK